MSADDKPIARTQVAWHQLAKQVEQKLYADNSVNAYGTPVPNAIDNWRRKKYPASGPSLKCAAECMAYELSTRSKRVTVTCVLECFSIISQWRWSPIAKALSADDD